MIQSIISTEVNSYAPEFTPDTPILLMVPKDLPTRAVITLIRATDNGTNVNTRTFPTSYVIPAMRCQLGHPMALEYSELE